MSTCIVIVTYNGTDQLLECLDSVFRTDVSDFTVVVCDNASGEAVLDAAEGWANGLRATPPAPASPLGSGAGTVRGPVSCVRHDRATAEGGGRAGEDARLILVDNGANLGYAGGNNVGLRYALARDFDHAWLLNPDTVVTPSALRELRLEMARDPDIGMCGSTLLYYAFPHRVQAYGGARYNKWLALPRHLGNGDRLRAGRRPDRDEVLTRLAYVTGASMLVSRAFLEEIGLLQEDYFLYFEELDWAERARGRYRLAWAPDSIVYHHEGGSIGGKGASLTPDYHFMRNRLRFTRRFHPLALPTVYLALLLAITRRAARGQWDRAGMIAKLLFAP